MIEEVYVKSAVFRTKAEELKSDAIKRSDINCVAIRRFFLCKDMFPLRHIVVFSHQTAQMSYYNT